MDERRDLVDREELRRRIAEDPFSASEVWEMHLDAMPAVECPRGWTRDEVPVVRDALARDARVREIVQRMRGLQAAARPIMRPPLAEIAANDIAALYPSPGDGWGVWGEDDIPARLISEEQR